MKNVLFAILQFVLFLAVFAFGSILLPVLRLIAPVLGYIPSVVTKISGGTFQWDGVLLMSLLFAVILLVEAMRRRLVSAWPSTAAAFALAAIVGYVARFGFITR